MNQKFSLMMAQLNPTVGNLKDNFEKIMLAWNQGKSRMVDLVALPEMFLTGYQIQDLVKKKAFMSDVAATIKSLSKNIKNGPAVLVGAPVCENNKIYNAYYLINDGNHTVVSRKHHLPNTSVFDEKRVFSPGPISGPFEIAVIKIGSPICEDFWLEDVAETMVETGADLLISPNGSPYSRGKIDIRTHIMVQRSIESKVPLVYLNLVGGQDDLVFDGGSFVLNPGGKLAVRMPQFEESFEVVNFVKIDDFWSAEIGTRCLCGSEISQDYRAMGESLRDYVFKSGFSKVLLGLSGGVDSALVAAIACDSLGPENVLCVRLPSSISSLGSLDDARDLTVRLGCREETIAISQVNDSVNNILSSIFKDYEEDVTEENIQSRLRGLILMALSNKFKMMLLTTGNKSEVAVGYSTIYGDMAGGYNPIKDLYKTRVFETCKWRNETHENWMLAPSGEIIPNEIIQKPPSAELRLDQRDDDNLPPYNILDSILEGLIDKDLSVRELMHQGFEKDTIIRIEKLIYLSEYKRFQSAPGTHLTDNSFWSSRRYPMVQQWRDKS
jgi:NAD+ synthase